MVCVCFVWDQNFADLDVPEKCDGYNFLAHTKCSQLTAGEQKWFSLKNHILKYFYSLCENGLRVIPEL